MTISVVEVTVPPVIANVEVAVHGIQGAQGPQGPAYPFAGVPDEVGVVDSSFPVGDVRRYGVTPDGVTNWEVSYASRIANIFANSLNPRILIYWPRGLYKTSINVSALYSGSRMHFDHAIFAGIVHLVENAGTPIENVHWTGRVSTYDRLGLQNAKNIILPEYIAMLSDAAVNTSGTGNRGVHFLTCENIRWGLIDVFDTGPSQTSLPGATSIWAGFAIQSQGKKNFSGKVRVRDASGHGVYINALDLDIDIRVEGYGKSAIDISAALEGTDSEAQSEQGCGIWLNRCTGRVSLHVEQKNASPADDVYSVLIDETGVSSVADSRHKQLEITSLYATVGNGNRGVCVGEALAASVHADVLLSGPVDIRLRAANTLESGYAGLNVLPPSTASSSLRRVRASGVMSFTNFGAVQMFKATAATGTHVLTDIDIAKMRTPNMGAGRFAQFDGTGGLMRGQVHDVEIYMDSGSSTVPVIDIDGCENFHLRGGRIRSNSAVNTRAIRFNGNVNSSVRMDEIYNFGRSTDGGVYLGGNSRCVIGPINMDRVSLANTAFQIEGTHTDCLFQGLNATNFAEGATWASSPTFTRCTAVQCTLTGNTDDTDLTVAMFPAANQIGCTNWAI